MGHLELDVLLIDLVQVNPLMQVDNIIVKELII